MPSDEYEDLMKWQEDKHALTKKILDDQVHELRELRQSYPDLDAPTTPVTASTRIKHLLLLEESNNMEDIIPISKAINYLLENFPPHLLQQNDVTDEKAEKRRKNMKNPSRLILLAPSGVSPSFSSTKHHSRVYMIMKKTKTRKMAYN
ncbi:hypothetical protein QTG54_003614 [Skeletonema marinoi]|uniref:Uncharacterized protein n=1 Tax=Skeletonema marinoi TaxID=267567 RepID=A0AAD8YHR7_9STRA|nr:hypothetical protein QTG54_003614 [Skeletonema marinoi]